MLLWQGKKMFFGKPWTFTKYSVTDTIVTSTTGFLTKDEQQLNLFKITDIDLKQTFVDRLCKQGTLVLHSTQEDFTLECIKDPYIVKELLNELIDKQQRAHQVRMADVHLDAEEINTDISNIGGDTYI